MSGLPDRPSELIRLALRDLREVEADRAYRVDMYTWHHPEGLCAVCMAGAVMARSLGVDRDTNATPESFDLDVCTKLMAINAFREGHVAIGLGFLGSQRAGVPRMVEVSGYGTDPEGFYLDMELLADLLEGAGL